MRRLALAAVLGLVTSGWLVAAANAPGFATAKPKPPQIARHADVTAQATSAKGAIVRYARASVTGAAKVVYSKASGTLFPVGKTVVTITATGKGGVARSRFTVTVTAQAGPAPPTTTTHANRAPEWPSPFNTSSSTEFQYDANGRMAGALTTITVPQATDPDGDALTYSWSATNGTIAGDGVSARWTRLLIGGRVQAGDVVVTADDGHGGKTPYTIKFR